jgi:hypothetical protein
VDLRAIVQLGALGQLENLVTSMGIKLVTFWLVAQCLNELCYDVSLFELYVKNKEL